MLTYLALVTNILRRLIWSNFMSILAMLNLCIKSPFQSSPTLKFELNEMVDHGVLVPHSYDNSAGNGWSFPCRYVTKKDGGKRLVTQFMKLNEVTVRDP